MEQFAANLAGGLRRFAMAGVGAITLTVDKSREIIEQLAERGEVTAAEGQAACDELHKRLTEQVSAFTQKLRADYENLSFEQMLARCDRLTPEQKQRLMDRLTAQPAEAETQAASAEPNETAAAQTDSAEAIEPKDQASSTAPGESGAAEPQTESDETAESGPCTVSVDPIL